MPRALPALILAVALLSGCGSVMPPPSLAPGPSLGPTPSPVSTPSIGPTPSPAPTPSPEPTFDPGNASPAAPPLIYDWSKFPRPPMLTLVAGRASVKAAAVAGCVTRFYEPRNDEFGRIAQSDPVCLKGPLPRTAPLVVAAGAVLVVRPPDGYMLGAEVTDGTEVYAIVSASQFIPARIDAIGLIGASELAREPGFGILEIQFVAPTQPGDYLVTVAAQYGTVDRTYRELDTAFLFRLRVTAG